MKNRRRHRKIIVNVNTYSVYFLCVCIHVDKYFFLVSVYFLCVCIHVDKYFSVSPSFFHVYLFTLTSIFLCLRLFFLCMYSRCQVFFCVSVYFYVYLFTLTSIFPCLRLFFVCIYSRWQVFFCVSVYILCVCIHVNKYFSVSPSIFCVYVIHTKNRRRHRKILVNVNKYT
jgi:hypothetical protein